ncbi:2-OXOGLUTARATE (2OG) AND FE(II)-DEPENDENT OXYGENASE SUPERFAMILY PROTEIN [Salix purpurea]|uniref:2-OXOGLUTARATE (2OG) AND FE(II)-DEPENDENT OXYGENASE SUPERFAMILY PROTEIN n=1 Tax=Salix purpurea TaxID=77065 RepID=A0A9Q0YVM5_SALPP|nr:2-OXOGLUTARATE (2OG) AND FE(II)-DEPENDENT OXYGENASE SUPERFAMILY PROTEIN [Salix purpurea]
MGSERAPKIPVVHLSKENFEPGSSSWLAACADIRRALEEYSFFEIVYSEPSMEFYRETMSALEELFNLPHETKKRNTHPKLGHGYMGKIPGFPEGLGIEYATKKEECQKFASLMWPDGNEKFCEVIHSFTKIISELHQMVVRMLFESYGIKKDYEPLISSTNYLLRLLKYGRSLGETNVGFKAHMDKTFLTLLYQNPVKGLEIRTKEGEWITYEPSSPTSFAVIAGDVCMAWSNDRIKSSYHRVVVNSAEDRYALGLFTFLDGVVQVPEELVDDEHPLQYKPFEHQKLLDFYQSYDDPNKRDCNIMKTYCGV